jgi:hypothetical protein
MRHVLLAALVSLAACGGSPPPAEEPAAGAPTMVLFTEGEPVWPPSGPGCDALIACCDDAATVDKGANFAYQLAIAAANEKGEPEPCVAARADIAAMLAEQNAAIPATCTAPR